MMHFPAVEASTTMLVDVIAAEFNPVLQFDQASALAGESRTTTVPATAKIPANSDTKYLRHWNFLCTGIPFDCWANGMK